MTYLLRTAISGLSALGLSLLVLSGCEPAGAGGTTPAPDTGASGTATAPPSQSPPKPASMQGPGKLVFDESVADLGTIWDTAPKSAIYTFRNVGGAAVAIQDIKTSCGCTTTSLTQRVFRPGDQGTLEVTFDPEGKSGRQTKDITVMTNAPGQDAIALEIDSFVRRFVTLEPEYVLFKTVALGERHRKVVSFTCADPNFEVVGVEAVVRALDSMGNQEPQPWLQARRLAPSFPPGPNDDPSGDPEIEIIIDETAPWGTIYGTVFLRVKGRTDPGSPAIVHTAKYVVNASVKGELSIADQMMRAGVLRPNQPFEARVRLSREGGRAFEVKRIDIMRTSLAGLTAEAVPVGAGAYDLVVRGVAGAVNTNISGHVEVTTDLPGAESVINVRFNGIVRLP